MVQRDYILRMIEQMGAAWAALLSIAGLVRQGRQGEAQQALDQITRQFLGLNSGLLDTLSAEELIALVRLGRAAGSDDDVVLEKLTLLASILRERSNLRAAQGDEAASADFAHKALQIFLTVLAEDDPANERAAAAIGPLLDQLADYDPPAAVKEQLWHYHESRGEFASAEDWLFKLLDDAPTALREGIAFYARLADHDDVALVRGGLPRDEVAAGGAELRARLAEAEEAGV